MSPVKVADSVPFNTQVAAHERRRGAVFGWLLLLREDAHFFAPLQLTRFAPHAVHGKACARYGGWNDHIFLIPRDEAS